MPRASDLPTSGEHRTVVVYLDHTFLDLFEKKRLKNFLKEFRGTRIVPVFSVETLREIERSKGHEHSFLDALAALDAKLIEPRTEGYRFTDDADLLDVDPHAEYQEFLHSKIDVQDIDVLLMELSQALTGARPVLRVAELLAQLRQRGLGMARDAIDQAKGLGALPPDLQAHLHELQLMLEKENFKAPSPNIWQPASAEELDRDLAGGSLHLNNIRPPRVVEQIWQRMPKAKKASLSIGAYFGAEPDDGRTLSRAEKAQRVFNMLGILGYYRDPNLDQMRRMESLMSDMGHVAFASYCHVFATRDNRLAKRSAAAYEFVGCPTRIIPLTVKPAPAPNTGT